MAEPDWDTLAVADEDLATSRQFTRFVANRVRNPTIGRELVRLCLHAGLGIRSVEPSAVTVTIRQVSGALGVAVLGSVLSSAYLDRLGANLPGQPTPEIAKDGIAGALAVAGRLPGESGTALAAAAREAFIHGMDTTLHVGCGVALAGAVLALIWLPARTHRESTEVETVPAGQAEPSPATPA
jgi:hypothetical protein